MKQFILFCFLIMFFVACSEDPNELGGSTDVEFAKVGSKTIITTRLEGIGDIDGEVIVTENRGGIVVSKGVYQTDTAFTNKIDTLLGTATLPPAIKEAIRNKAIRVFNVVIDSSNKNDLKIEFTIKTKVTSEGLQDFVHSEGDESKPFTIIKYSAGVGTKYEFTDKDGNKFVREVTYRSSDDDYPIAFWLIKVIKVEETITEGPLKDIFGKIVYYTNHKFGLVGVEWVRPTDGKVIKFTIFPPNL